MPNKNFINYSVIIPAYNEEKAIVQVLKELSVNLNNPGQAHEIIVVNDCSTDGTKEEILDSTVPVILIDHALNKGYGAALKTGMAKAKYDLIVIIDADGTYPIDMIPELVSVASLENQDMVVGARISSEVKIPLIRRPAKLFINMFANYLLGFKIPDLNSGLRVMKKSVVKQYLKILPDGFSFTSTISMAMLTNGYSVKYVPINYYSRKGKSKIKPVQDTLNFIQLIIRTALYFNPLRIFVPLSLSLVLLAFLVLFGSWLLLGKAMDVSFGVIIMTAVIILAIGMLADLIDKRIQ